MVVTSRPLARSRSGVRPLVVPLAMWAAWRVAHLVLETAVGGRPDIWWDDLFYTTILRHGYGHPDAHHQFLSTNFFPLLSWTTHAVQVVVRSEWLAIHTVLTGAQIATVLLLHRIGVHVGGRRVGTAAVALLLLLPMSVFFWMFFSEGLFLALSMGAILAADRGRDRLAAVVGIGVAATRTLGVLVVIPLALAQLQRGERSLRRLALTFLPAIGTLVVMAAQWVQAGDPLAFTESSKGWGRESSLPVTTILQRLEHAFSTALTLTTVLDLATLALALVFAVHMTRAVWPGRPPAAGTLVLPWSMVAWTWLMIVAPLSSGLAFSWARYMLAAWPVLLVAGDAASRRPLATRTALGAALCALTVLEALAWHHGEFIG